MLPHHTAEDEKERRDEISIVQQGAMKSELRRLHRG